MQVPLGLSESDRQKYLEMPIEQKIKTILEPEILEQQKLMEGQQEYEEERIEKKFEKMEGPITQLPASPFIPEVDQTITASMAPVIDPTSGLTRTQTALLSPSEQVIAKNRNQGIMGLV